MTPVPVAVKFSNDSFTVELSDGRHFVVALSEFPKLLAATPAQRAAVRMTPGGLHWVTLTKTLG